MEKYYTSEKNIQILIALLKSHNIHKVVASPGTTNLSFVASIQQDSWFEIYSSVDERSAAYIACGMAEEANEPVVLTCTEATASRNYMSGLTEAYYRKLPILAVTGTRGNAVSGNHIEQSIDRSVLPKDVVKFSVELPIIKDETDEWFCELNANKAILELFRHGGGPVHINLVTVGSRDFNVRELPKVNAINRISYGDEFPKIPNVGKKIGIYVGSHSKFSEKMLKKIDKFCSIYNAVVFCDHNSNYKGEYRVLFSLIGAQEHLDKLCFVPDILIYIGEISGGSYFFPVNEVWRVSDDGEIRDKYRRLRYVFEMQEQDFFDYYINFQNPEKIVCKDYLKLCTDIYKQLYNQIPEMPFSNVWIAQKIATKIPHNSTIYFGILNSLRSWNFFEIPQSVDSHANVGGFGIDGGISSLLGASFVAPNKLFFGVIGDLAFFYDMNALGNRHILNNVRILLVNNGRGTEFRNYWHPGYEFGDDADKYIAAAGHFGNKSHYLVKHYANDLGFQYLSASNKDEFLNNVDIWLDSKLTEKPILFEVFTETSDESNALKLIRNIAQNKDLDIICSAKKIAKKIFGKN